MAGEVAPLAPEEEDGAQAEEVWAETADEAYEASAVVATPPVWSRLLGQIFGRPGLDDGRLRRLDRAVARHPDAPANYVLRGELYLRAGEPDLAAVDFETALDLASARLERDDWGVLSQAIRDQAEYGLERARRRLKKQ